MFPWGTSSLGCHLLQKVDNNDSMATHPWRAGIVLTQFVHLSATVQPHVCRVFLDQSGDYCHYHRKLYIYFVHNG